MTVTTSYSLGSTQAYFIQDGFSSNNLDNLDLTSLASGGFAYAADHLGYGHVDAGVNGFESFNLTGSNGALDQLKSGNVVGVSESGGNIYWAEMDSSGYSTPYSGDLGLSAASNADVAALSGGRFAVSSQISFGGSDNDIHINLRGPTGDAVTGFSIDASGADDENASIAAIHGGGFAVAWDRDIGGGVTQGWSAVYNSDGATMVAAHAFDTSGSHNTGMSLVGLAKGGYAVAYADSEWTGSNDHITVAIYKANGSLVSKTDVSPLTGGNEAEASLTVLQDGTLAVSWTHEFNGSDHDIYMQMLDPKTGALLLDGADLITITGDNEHHSSIVADGAGQVLVGWYDDTTGGQAEEQQIFVDREGDAGKNHIIGSGAYDTINGFASGDVLKGLAGNDSIDGGDGKDLINGGLGTDLLTGGTGKDTFQFSSIGDSYIGGGDTITDLEGKDRINLAAIDADINTAGNQAFHIVGAFSGAAGEMTIDFNVTHAGVTTILLDINGDGSPDGEIILTGDHSTFSNYVL